MGVFYDHIILIHEVHGEIESLSIPYEEKIELVKIIEEAVHYKILHKILDHLDEDYHEDFLGRFHVSPNEGELLIFLKEQIPDIEQKIKEASDEIKFELIKKIREG